MKRKTGRGKEATSNMFKSLKLVHHVNVKRRFFLSRCSILLVPVCQFVGSTVSTIHENLTPRKCPKPSLNCYEHLHLVARQTPLWRHDYRLLFLYKKFIKEQQINPSQGKTLPPFIFTPFIFTNVTLYS